MVLLSYIFVTYVWHLKVNTGDSQTQHDLSLLYFVRIKKVALRKKFRGFVAIVPDRKVNRL
jgi:hypothetical protein